MNNRKSGHCNQELLYHRFWSELYHRKLAILAFKNSPRRNQISPAFEHPSSYEKVEPYCKTKYKMSPSSVRSEGGEAAAGYCLNSVSYRVDEAVKYNVLNSD